MLMKKQTKKPRLLVKDYQGNVERMGIMNARYTIPPQHQYSDRLMELLNMCMTADPEQQKN